MTLSPLNVIRIDTTRMTPRLLCRTVVELADTARRVGQLLEDIADAERYVAETGCVTTRSCLEIDRRTHRAVAERHHTLRLALADVLGVDPDSVEEEIGL